MALSVPRAARLPLLGAFALLAGAALAQPGAYPAKPIQLIAQQPPGSGSDAMTRVGRLRRA
jgi:tripartite-type tricarboxylate transporter receptor subunit TctC